MQISGFPVFSPLIGPSQRADASDRPQKEVRRETVEIDSSSDKRNNNSSLDEIRSGYADILQQRVESSAASGKTSAQRSSNEDSLPLKTQRALQAFAENTPSPEQQLGIELVGVDTFA